MNTQFIEEYGIILALIALWDLFWKGLALWRAAHRDSKVWFVVLLIINSVGILPIIYLLLTGGLTLSQGSHKQSAEE